MFSLLLQNSTVNLTSGVVKLLFHDDSKPLMMTMDLWPVVQKKCGPVRESFQPAKILKWTNSVCAFHSDKIFYEQLKYIQTFGTQVLSQKYHITNIFFYK